MELVKRKSVRNSNIELLRIISMILIVLSHLSVHGLLKFETDIFVNKCIVDILSFGGKLGVNCFFIITGYFYATKKVSVKKTFVLIGQLLFYSVLFYLLFTAKNGFSVFYFKKFIASIPFLGDQYWFVSEYIIVIAFSGLINKLFDLYQKNTLRIGAFVIVFFGCLIPTLFLGKIGYVIPTILLYFLMYFIGAYIKTYADIQSKNSLKYLWVSILTITFIFIMSVLLNVGIKKFGTDFITDSGRLLFGFNSIFIFLLSIELFLLFISIKPRQSSFVNLIAGGTFGVYLIHENDFVRKILWGRIVDCENLINDNLLLIKSIVVVFAIYIFCTAIDIARKYTVEKLYVKILDKYYDKFSLALSRTINKACNVVGKIF